MKLSKLPLGILGAILLVLLACLLLFRRHEAASSSVSIPPGAPAMSTPSTPTDTSGFYIDDEKERPMDIEEIRQQHRELLLRALPEYALQLRGGFSFDKVDSCRRVWFFTIPQNRIPDFQQYLIDCGVPAGNLRQDARMPFEVLPPPDPPATRLRFIYSKKAVGNHHARGMHFDQNSTVVYLLRNENIARSIWIHFSHDNGNVMIGELRPD